MSKLKGTARESVRDKEFKNLQELISHQKKRFAPTKKYQWYFEAIVNLRMKQTESVSDYYDRTFGLLSGAKHSLEEKYSGPTDNTSSMMKPVTDCALDAFIHGLPEEMLTFVDTRNPRNLDEAYERSS